MAEPLPSLASSVSGAQGLLPLWQPCYDMDSKHGSILRFQGVIDITQETVKLFFYLISCLIFPCKNKFCHNCQYTWKIYFSPQPYFLLFILASILTYLNGVYIKLQERKNDRKVVLHRVRRNDLNIDLFYSLSVFIYARFSSVYNFHRNPSPTKISAVSKK